MAVDVVLENGSAIGQNLIMLNLRHLDYVNSLPKPEVDVLVVQVQRRPVVVLSYDLVEVVNYAIDFAKLVVHVHFYAVSKVVDKIHICVTHEVPLNNNGIVREAF